MDALDSLIFQAIKEVRENHKRPDEASIYEHLKKDLINIDTSRESLENRINLLIEKNILINKPIGNKNSPLCKQISLKQRIT